MGKGGRPEKWGEPTSPYAVRWPVSHRRLYERRAAKQGVSYGEYVIRIMAEVHRLEVPPLKPQHDSPQKRLPLTA